MDDLENFVGLIIDLCEMDALERNSSPNLGGLIPSKKSLATLLLSQ